ncbi:hypothetical protein PPYR_04690 [Photinus pyralis]|uniref:DNA mismatch repair proteins mutS family domain-containing protein n=1 Tax=Photinus pyralis TaxID=7054 RepID=A0A5N4AYU6_PHOPY|nr:mutS protein homolog 5-like [Photinus pyralis]KAB0802504.1 hypothetical protein PPYR_04690 [Photinus pyralis]
MNSNSNQTPETLFSIRRNESSSIRSDTSDRILPVNEVDEDPFCVLCILWKSGKLGAAYFRSSERQLYVLQEVMDVAPEFGVTRSLFREVNPSHTLTTGNISDMFVKCIINILKGDNNEEDNSNNSHTLQTNTLPANITLLNIKDYCFDNCEHKAYNVTVSSEPKDLTVTQQEVFRHSLIGFDSKVTVHALGALIKYLEKNWSHINTSNTELTFLHINKVSLNDSVLIDQNTFNSLQIFDVKSHDSNFKRGLQSHTREGFSIYRLLSQHCISKIGYQCLRSILANPTNNVDELKKRLDFIQFALDAKNQTLIENLQETIKKISDLTFIFRKIQYARGNARDWETLYTTIYNMLFLHELCTPYVKSVAIFATLDRAITAKLYNLQASINNGLDFSQGNKRVRPLIKMGLDSELDKKELQKCDISKNATAAARIVLNQLPQFIDGCSVVYMPELGHFVVIKEWEANCDKKELEEHGLQFVFELNQSLHYKNALCTDMDKQLGNIYLEILFHENRIIQRLTDFVLSSFKEILEPLKIIAMIDCLIGMSRVSKEGAYVRPSINESSIMEIEDGRHPLLELFCTNFVPNSYFSGGESGRMKIITGPNDSGKTIFLKQIALIVYLAHIGCYVPVKKANIGIMSSIHSKIHINESASVSLSAFMLDLTQMSQSLHNAKKNSLVLIDEFGRGTTGDDGFALFTGALKSFVEMGDLCPHVVVCTHFQQMSNYLSGSDTVSFLKMDYEKRDSDIVYLYKVVDGISNSFAFDVAKAAGLDENIISRAREFYQLLCGDGVSLVDDNQFEPITFNIGDINIPDLN